MRMLAVPVLFLVSRARDSCGSFAKVETLKTLQAFRSSTRKQDDALMSTTQQTNRRSAASPRSEPSQGAARAFRTLPSATSSQP